MMIWLPQKSSSSAKMESIAAESIKDTSIKPVLEGLNEKEPTAKVPPDVIKKDSDVITCMSSSKSNTTASRLTVSEAVLKEQTKGQGLDTKLLSSP